ncbi:hypothetical protein M422DRAFT_244541 [Sphaerobolus stellatus SS14]|nr:hypothetical protein M422DRAFT_244541 [Sphaerobolus stellatus SS14]
MFSKSLALFALIAVATAGYIPTPAPPQPFPSPNPSLSPSPPPFPARPRFSSSSYPHLWAQALRLQTAQLLGLLGIVVQGVDVLVGLDCTTIPVIGGALGASCAQQPVCCENNHINGLNNIGCTPISL